MSGRTLRGALAWLFMVITLGFLVVIWGLIVAQPGFPLNFPVAPDSQFIHHG